MSRKDTIIIALLINTGLLALLFMLAVNSDDEKIDLDQSIVASTVNMTQTAPPKQPVARTVIAETQVVDEVDHFLKELTPEERGQAILIDDEGFIELEREPAIAVTRAVSPAETVVSHSVEAKPVNSITANQEFVEVTVKRGDALEKIARSNGTTVDAIKKLNHLTSANLSIGQVLRVPLGKKSIKAVETAAALPKGAAIGQSASAKDKTSTTPSEIKYYTIKSGDNPWKIARQFDVKFEDLLVLNNLNEEKARNLKVGDKIRVR